MNFCQSRGSFKNVNHSLPKKLNLGMKALRPEMCSHLTLTSKLAKTSMVQVVVVMAHQTAAARLEKYRMMKTTVQAAVGARP